MNIIEFIVENQKVKNDIIELKELIKENQEIKNEIIELKKLIKENQEIKNEIIELLKQKEQSNIIFLSSFIFFSYIFYYLNIFRII